MLAFVAAAAAREGLGNFPESYIEGRLVEAERAWRAFLAAEESIRARPPRK